MKKIIVIDGGMKGRVEDLDLIQVASQTGLSAILRGLLAVGETCIVNGLVASVVDGEVTVTEGYYFDGTEIYYIPGGTFSATGDLYIIANYTSTELRHFHDNTDHNVWAVRNWALGQGETIPTGGIDFYLLQYLSQQNIDNILAIIKLKNHFVGAISLAYAPPFNSVTTYHAIAVEINAFDDVMISAAFFTTANGKIATLPPDYRPSGDLERAFSANGSVGILKIKSNGELWVANANCNGGVNVITCQFQRIFEDLVGYHFPTSGGMPDLPSLTKIIKNGINANTFFPSSVKAGMILNYIIIENTTTNTAQLSFSTVDGGCDLGAGITINPKVGEENGVTTIKINTVISLYVDMPIYINTSHEGDTWEDTTVNITIKLSEI